MGGLSVGYGKAGRREDKCREREERRRRRVEVESMKRQEEEIAEMVR